MLTPTWIAFDVYASLIDREAGAGRAFAEILRLAGATHLAPDRVFNAWHHAVIRRYRTSFIGWKDAGREVMPDIRRRFRIRAGNPDDIQILYDSFPTWQPYPHVADILRTLQTRFRIAAVTNMDTDLFLATDAGIKWDGWVTSELAGAYKPHPAIFDFALRRFGCGRDELLWVGTTPWADVLGARLAGIPVVWLNRPRGRSCGPTRLQPWEPTPDHEIRDLGELLGIVGLRADS
jgi:2-haloacid dehalogenase